MNKPRPRLRAPFVATVAACAALAGCALTVASPAPRCPTEAPAQGASCDPAAAGAAACDYGLCLGRPLAQATCDAQTRRWAVSALPCAMPTPVRPCPTEAPAQGASCDLGRNPASCSYGWSECIRGPAVTAFCEGAAWRLAVATCNPPAPTCPASAPQTGGACVLPAGTECTYGDCGGSPTTYARCDGGTWQVAEASCNPPPPTCPANVPSEGEPCALPSDAPACTWGSCDADFIAIARCVAGRWQHLEAGCERPPAACPSAAPIAGDRCDHPASAECHYGSCGAVSALNYTCRGGVWVVDRAMCGDYCPPARPLAGSACSRDASSPCRYPGAVCDGAQLWNQASCNPMTNRWVITEYVCR